MFISFEGRDFVGKSTQVQMLANWIRDNEGFNVVVTHEPGGTPLGNRLRKILLENQSEDGGYSAQAQTLLFLASRVEIVEKVIRPALNNHVVVIADRYIDSTTVYQQGGKNIQSQFSFPVPDATILLDLPDGVFFGRNETDDYYEQKGTEYLSKIARSYRRLASKHRDRFIVIDALGSPQEVHKNIKQALADRGVVKEMPL